MIDGVLNRDVLSFEIEKSCIDDKKVIGSFQKNSATIELLNPDNKYSNLKGTYIKTYKGTFYVDNIEPIQEKIKIKLSCYDLAQKFEKLYDSSKFTFPLTLKAWRNAICTEVGVEYDNTDFPNSDYELSNEPYIKKDATYKDVIKLIAQASSCWTIIDYDDKLYFNWFNNTLIEVQDWFDLTTEDEPTDPVNIVVLGRGVVEDNVIYPETEPANPKEIRIDSNDILDLNRKKMIVPIYNQVKDFKYMVFSMKTIGFLNAKIGNKIKYPDLYNNKKESYIMCHKLTFLGGDYSDKRNYTSQFEAVELDETSTNYKYAESIEERIDKTEIITNKLNGEIRSITTKVTKVTNTANDALQKANDGLSNVNVQYYLSTSNTTLSGGTWSDNAPSWVDGKYMWSRTKVTNAKGEVSYEPGINGTCIAGATGATGKDGINGKDGVNGKSITIKSKAIEYQASTSGTSAPTGTWTTTIPNVNKGSYLWTRTTVTYSDDTNTVSYSVAYRGTDGIDGTNGTNGTNGKDGKGITSITYYYATSTSQTAPSEANITSTTIPTLNATNKYLWQKEVIKFSDNTNKTSILLIAVYGDKGQTGATGKGVKSIVEQYYLSSSSTAQTGGDWSNTQPNWVNGKYIWTKSHITWSDNTTTDTTPILANGLNKANSTANTANGNASTALNTVNNLSIGGRNSLLNSGNFSELKTWEKNGGTLIEITNKETNNCIHAKGSIVQNEIYHLEWNTEYVYHCYAKFSVGSTMLQTSPLHYWIYKSNDYGSIGASNSAMNVTDYYVDKKGNKTIEPNKWHHLVICFKTIQKPTDYEFIAFRPFIYGGASITTANSEYWINWFKLEKGNKPTDWTPAPEDIDEDITTAQNTANKANSTATNAISMADSAKKDVQNTNENLMNNYYTISQTNELVQTAEDGLVNAYTTTGGANIFVNTGLWFVNDNNDQNVNPYEDWKGKALRKSNDEASNGNSILLQNGTFEQEQEVPNGNYSISFMYKKLISQSVASVVINGKEYQLNSTTLKEFYTGEKNEKNEYITEPIVVTAGHLKIQFKCNTNGGVEIYDLMANKGSIKLAYSQNQNETTTETVKISKGITITSTNMETIFKANANGIRILSLQNEKIAYFTDKGLSTKELIVENKAQMCSTLISEVGDQTWLTRM